MLIKMQLASKKRSYNSIISFTPAVGWGILVLYLSITPGDELPDSLVALNDKFLHGFIYFFSAMLLYLGSIKYDFSNKLSSRKMFYILLLCVLFGLFIELIQAYFIPRRDGDWKDFVANSLGASISLLVMRFSHNTLARRFKA